MATHRCGFGKGVQIRPDGIHPLLPCIVEEKEVHTNCTVSISQCRVCGHIEIEWFRTPETEDIIYGALGPQPIEDC